MDQPPKQDVTRIPEPAFLATQWTFYTIALITVCVRTVIRVRLHRKLQLDDFILIFATCCLTAVTIFNTVYARSVYNAAKVAMGLPSPDMPTTMEAVFSFVHRTQIFLYTFTSLTWTSIYAAKLAYLLFFRKLIDRVRPLVIYWWVVTVMTATGYTICILATFVACPYVDSKDWIKCEADKYFHLSYGLGLAACIFDIISDFMIVAIPIGLLWKLRIKVSQKINLGILLSLSIVMAVVAIVRTTGMVVTNSFNRPRFDSPWIWFWQELEACLAVTMVSLTAFRHVFVAQEKKRQSEEAHKAWYPSSIARKFTKQSKEEKSGELPKIPSATLTGLLTVFGVKRHGTQLDSTTSLTTAEDKLPADVESDASRIYVTKTFQTKVEECREESREDVVPLTEVKPKRFSRQSLILLNSTQQSRSSCSTVLPPYTTRATPGSGNFD